MPLRIVAQCIAALVIRCDVLDDDDLAREFESYYSVEVPQAFRSLLKKFAWSAKGHGFLERSDSEDGWVPGSQEAHEIAPFGDWTFSSVLARVRDLLGAHFDEQDIFETVVHEVYTNPRGRAPSIAMTVVGKGIHMARSRP